MSYKCWISRTSVAEVWVPYSVGLFEKKSQCLSAFFVLGTPPLFLGSIIKHKKARTFSRKNNK